MNISWIAGFDGNSAIQNYTVERSEDNAEFGDAACQGSLSDSSCVVSGTSASFENLSPWTTYYFKVFARNLVGTSDGSSVVNATTDEEGAVCKQCNCFNIHLKFVSYKLQCTQVLIARYLNDEVNQFVLLY